MPRMDLAQNYRYPNGRLFRAGRNVEVPVGFAEWLGDRTVPPSTATDPEAPSAAVEGYPYAELLASAKPKSYGTWDEVRAASDDDLIAVNGIGPARVREIRAWKPGA